MFPTNAYVIRRATPDDAVALRELAELDSRPALLGPALIGEIDGLPAAAVSLVDGRVVADPFKATARLRPLLQMRYRALRAFEETPSLTARVRAGVRVRKAATPAVNPEGAA